MPLEDQAFWLAVLDRIGPWVMGIITLATLYIKITRVETSINGRVTQLVAAKEEIGEEKAKAAHAEGELKGVTETAPAVIETLKPVVAPRDPNARTRKEDGERVNPPATPTPVTIVQNEGEPVIVRESEVPADRLPRAGRPPPYRPENDPTTHLGSG